jgi:hypothetical protein
MLADYTTLTKLVYGLLDVGAMQFVGQSSVPKSCRNFSRSKPKVGGLFKEHYNQFEHSNECIFIWCWRSAFGVGRAGFRCLFLGRWQSLSSRGCFARSKWPLIKSEWPGIKETFFDFFSPIRSQSPNLVLIFRFIPIFTTWKWVRPLTHQIDDYIYFVSNVHLLDSDVHLLDIDLKNNQPTSCSSCMISAWSEWLVLYWNDWLLQLYYSYYNKPIILHFTSTWSTSIQCITTSYCLPTPPQTIPHTSTRHSSQMSLLPRHLHHLHHLFIICHLAYLPDMVLMLPEICRIQEKESYERDVIHGCALASQEWQSSIIHSKHTS